MKKDKIASDKFMNLGMCHEHCLCNTKG